MPHAVACPYCGYRAPGKSSWDQYDKPEWQETALNICLIIYILIGATDLLLTFTNQNGTVYGGVWSMARTIVATGVLFRQEWAGAVFTYMLWMSLCCGGWMAGLGTMVGAWPFIVTGVLNMAISGFMIYLVQYALGD
ncbi:MAG: hypothetical protein SFX74_00680 [Fimbriimonadaceae bacterium]|nr:hypothetical protein [Fimbriimonadaceae bacterium]